MDPARRGILKFARATRRQILLNVTKRILLNEGRVADVIKLFQQTNQATSVGKSK